MTEEDYQKQIRELSEYLDKRAEACVDWLWEDRSRDNTHKAIRALLWHAAARGAHNREIVLERERRIKLAEQKVTDDRKDSRPVRRQRQ